MRLTRPSISDASAAALGRAVVANRWRGLMLRRAAKAIGAVLDDASGAPPLLDKARDELHDAMGTCLLYALSLETSP